jgi:hypothetical protein
MFWLLSLLQAAVAAPCPSYLDALDQAETAASTHDFEVLEAELAKARRGVACGPIIDNRVIRSRFWLTHAIMLDAKRDIQASDDALHAAWRADPRADLSMLPPHLRQRYTEVTEWPNDEAAFRMFPVPSSQSVIFIDGVATGARRADGEVDPEISTSAGLHIIQLVDNLDSFLASAGIVRNIPTDGVAIIDINDITDLFGGGVERGAFPSSISKKTSGGGCAGRR